MEAGARLPDKEFVLPVLFGTVAFNLGKKARAQLSGSRPALRQVQPDSPPRAGHAGGLAPVDGVPAAPRGSRPVARRADGEGPPGRPASSAAATEFCRCNCWRHPQVVFRLHESFRTPLREISAQPFELTEHGWGEFEIAATAGARGARPACQHPGGRGQRILGADLLCARSGRAAGGDHSQAAAVFGRGRREPSQAGSARASECPAPVPRPLVVTCPRRLRAPNPCAGGGGEVRGARVQPAPGSLLPGRDVQAAGTGARPQHLSVPEAAGLCASPGAAVRAEQAESADAEQPACTSLWHVDLRGPPCVRSVEAGFACGGTPRPCHATAKRMATWFTWASELPAADPARPRMRQLWGRCLSSNCSRGVQ